MSLPIVRKSNVDVEQSNFLYYQKQFEFKCQMDKKFASKLNFRVIWSTIDICQKSRKMSDTFSLWKQKILFNFLSNLFMTFQSLFYDLNTIVLREIQIIFNVNFFNQVFEIQFFRLVEDKLSWFDSSKSFEVVII